jgi:hypothetical protein
MGRFVPIALPDFLRRDIAMCIGAGEPWVEFDTRQGSGLYLDH